MTQPSEERIDASLDAMRADAAKWKQAAAELDGPTSVIGSLTLTAADVSLWAADKGLDSTYDNARNELESMLRKAAKYFQKIGDNLETAANQYENDDAHASQKLQETRN